MYDIFLSFKKKEREESIKIIFAKISSIQLFHFFVNHLDTTIARNISRNKSILEHDSIEYNHGHLSSYFTDYHSFMNI